MGFTELDLRHLLAYSIKSAEGIVPKFDDRTKAGKMLADKLDYLRTSNPIVLAIPNGGIPIAIPVVERFRTPVYLSIAAKIPLNPIEPRFGIGAVSSVGTVCLDFALIRDLELGFNTILKGLNFAKKVLHRTERKLAKYKAPLSALCNRTVIIIDDGIASGATTLVTISDLIQYKPSHIIVATAVISHLGYQKLTNQGVEVITLYKAPESGFLVDNFYTRFNSLTPADSRRMLDQYCMQTASSNIR